MINNGVIEKGFIIKQTIRLINFFFNQMMGIGSLLYIISLINYYSATDDDNLDKGLIIRASKLAINDDKPIILRQFFSTILWQ